MILKPEENKVKFLGCWALLLEKEEFGLPVGFNFRN